MSLTYHLQYLTYLIQVELDCFAFSSKRMAPWQPTRANYKALMHRLRPTVLVKYTNKHIYIYIQVGKGGEESF